MPSDERTHQPLPIVSDGADSARATKSKGPKRITFDEILRSLACQNPGCSCQQSNPGGRSMTHCPAHDDRNPSLSVAPPNGTAWPLVHCFAGCSFKAVISRLQETGLLPGSTTFVTGAHTHTRRDRGGRKTMSWDKGASSMIALYRAEVLASLGGGETVIVNEGEPATEAAVALGLSAVGTVCGANAVPEDAALSALGGFDVVLAPDNDEPGRTHMNKIGRQLAALGISCRWLQVPGLPDKGDLADYTGSPEELAALINSAPAWRDPRRRHLQFETPQEIVKRVAPSTEWVVEGLLARSAITELSAKVKVGKSTFWAMMVAKILQGRPFLGRATVRGGVILLTEERRPTIAELLRRVGLTSQDGLRILFRSSARGTPWNEVVACAIEEASRMHTTTLIVDTLPDWAEIRGDEENNTGAALAAMAPLQDAAAAGLAVLVVRHDRKAGGEIGDSARGSSAFAGVADILLTLRRLEGSGRDNSRRLDGVGRFDCVASDLIIELKDGEYYCVGTGTARAHQRAMSAILDFLPTVGEGAKSEAEIVESTGISRSTLMRALSDGMKRGEIKKIPSCAGPSGRAAGYARLPSSTSELDVEQQSSPGNDEP